jgi:hypothetical protein
MLDIPARNNLLVARRSIFPLHPPFTCAVTIPKLSGQPFRALILSLSRDPPSMPALALAFPAFVVSTTYIAAHASILYLPLSHRLSHPHLRMYHGLRIRTWKLSICMHTALQYNETMSFSIPNSIFCIGEILL